MKRDALMVDAGDVQLAVYVSGPRDAPPVVLVHGYPDSATVWDAVRAQLDSRYRVICYDVRGAGLSEAPAGRAGYRLERLADDLAAVADSICGAQPFHLVGHDWGSIQCWEAVTRPSFEGRIASFTSISGPSLDHASMGLRSGSSGYAASPPVARRLVDALRQTLKSWYIFFFHLPWLPELVWRCGGARAWPLWLRLTERVQPLRDPAQLRNAINGLNLYRANFIERLRRPRARHAHAPVQFIVPLRDRYVGPALSLGLERWLGDYTRDTVDAGHWVVLRDAPGIAARIDAFATRHAAACEQRARHTASEYTAKA
ncbi:alpha/beta fold hydrolase [Paraburkholderia sp. DHOC27]|uniref:alpha/beta fold hydrolase n=1 Tax=Paraburkholderia sp. DHOC27 TaxID=2303330 RepID=UPI000E3C23D6|nr:alpha/beta fold hydrolase [Paraburkholderia sp. DHOC27]RFU44133.1 alpha/beta fold hydrolase [Paraburkholderia sp. DHOC27]